MTEYDNHHEARSPEKKIFVPRFPFNSPTNAPAGRAWSELAARTEQQKQADLEAVQQRRAYALEAQRRLAAQRALTDDGFREELARAQQRCSQNRQDDRCPPECVVRQWRRGVPLQELNGMEVFRRRLDGGR